MKAVILAGGLGTRISEETHLRPKPMIEIGGQPILWHIMKIYSAFGLNDFIICLGYKGYVVKEYFSNYFLHTSDVTFDFTENKMEVHRRNAEPWRVTLIDTGEDTMTGGRLKRVGKYLDDDDFCFTYGDGVGDVNISALIAFHRKQQTLATVTAVQPPGRFGSLDFEQNRIVRFEEKPQCDRSWVNGGFSFFHQRFWTTLMEIRRCGKKGHLSVWQRKGSWPPTVTWASGSPWIHNVIEFISKSCGTRERHPGRFGNRYESLAWEEGVRNRSYRF